MSAERPVDAKHPLPRGLHAAVQTGFLVVITLIVLVPLLAIFVGTFQDGNEVIRKGLSLDIDLGSLSLDNYVMLFTDSGMYFRWFANSIFLTVVQVAGTLLVSSFVAYGFAMYDFKGKNALFISVLLLMTVPFEIMMLPLFVMVNDVGLADSYSVIVFPFLAAAVTIFYFRQYFLGIPKDLLEAGRIDGATEFGIFFKLVLPIYEAGFRGDGHPQRDGHLEQLPVAAAGAAIQREVHAADRTQHAAHPACEQLRAAHHRILLLAPPRPGALPVVPAILRRRDDGRGAQGLTDTTTEMEAQNG